VAEFFGFEIKRKETPSNSQTFTAPTADDGVQTIMGGGHYGTYLDIEGKVNNEADLIRRYREVAMQPECDQAIEDVINEGIVIDDNRETIRLNLHTVPFSTAIKKRIQEEFNNILSLLEFEQKGHDIFRRWYVDGRIVYHKVIDPNDVKKGITELRYIDPRKIKKVRKPKKKDNEFRPKDPSKPPHVEFEEFYIYNEKGVQPGASSTQGLAITKDAIAFCPSGMVDQQRNMILSHLHKAIKPVNQLRMIEDSIVIYRISRAPERRIFYIDVGNLPKQKAEQYLKDVMNRYRNKLVYDASTGEIRDDRQYMSMLEDFWLPRREGGRGTEITTLPGGSNLGEVEDIKYFQKKLYKSLNVPVSRLEAEGSFNMGRATEINRDELKFSKFVDRLRTRFNALFHDLLKTQLILKGVISIEDWENTLARTIRYNYVNDGYYAEIKESEMFKERMEIYRNLKDSEMIGNIYSKEWAMKNILKMTDIDIKDEQDKIEKEKEAEAPPEGEDDDTGQF
tara:strand:+ start:23539 stop:25062 length:1524 start_codon:yes stop_codon:yes gene_type:complete